VPGHATNYSVDGVDVYFPLGEKSFVSTVVSFEAGQPAAEDRYSVPNNAIGPPDYNERTDTGYVSLGCGGRLVVRFSPELLRNLPGPDLYIFEIGRGRESYNVELSANGDQWIDLGQHQQTAILDLEGQGRDDERFEYVRLTDLKSDCSSKWAGADIDAIGTTGSSLISATGDGGIFVRVASWAGSIASWGLLEFDTKNLIQELTGTLKSRVSLGQYRFFWRQSHEKDKKVTSRDVLTITSGQATVVNLNTGLSISVPNWSHNNDKWELRDIETGKYVTSGSRSNSILAPPGIYDLVWRTAPERGLVQLSTIKLFEGERLHIDLDTGFHLAPADNLAGVHGIWRLARSDSSRIIAELEDICRPVPVPPGRYHLLFTPLAKGKTSIDHTYPVEIKAGVVNIVSVPCGVRENDSY